MICLIALVVFGLLSVFSATHRAYATEAFDCVFRKATLRPCNTGFDEKMRGKVVGILFQRSPAFAGLVHKNFEAVSWFFTILMIASMAYTAYGAYNLITIGTCDPANPQNCIFTSNSTNATQCPFQDYNVNTGGNTIADFTKLDYPSKQFAYFFGTTWCPHCKWEKPIFERVAAKFPSVTTKVIEVDTDPTNVEINTFNHYSPSGSIPVVIVGGNYYRIGSGEQAGEVAEELALTALFCDISNDASADCSKPEVQAMKAKI